MFAGINYVAASTMAFKLTYTDGEADDFGDDTAWVVEGGVLKMGREPDSWTVLVSSSHWATIEVTQDRPTDGDKGEDKDEDEDKGEDKDKDKGEERNGDD